MEDSSSAALINHINCFYIYFMKNATNVWLMEKQFGVALGEEWEKAMFFKC